MNWLYGRNSRLPYVHTMNVLNNCACAGRRYFECADSGKKGEIGI